MTEKRRSWNWKNYVNQQATSGWEEREASFAQDRESIATAISAPGRAVKLARGVERLSGYYGTLAIKQITEENTAGWGALVISCKLLQLATRLGITIVRSGNSSFGLHLGATVDSFFGSFGIGDRKYSEWCARELVSSLETGLFDIKAKKGTTHWKLHSAYALAATLAATHLGLANVPGMDKCAPPGPYEHVVSALRSKTISAEAMNAMCDAHLADLRKSYNVFAFHPFALWPTEVFAVQDVAQRAGVSVELDMSHPLLATPFARRPTPSEASCNPLDIKELEAYCAREFPDAWSW